MIPIILLTILCSLTQAADSEKKDDKYVDYHAEPHYAFEYAVHDPHTGDVHSQKEERKGDFTQGEYSLVEADGSVRTVKYVVRGKSGFKATVIKDKKPFAGHEAEVTTSGEHKENDDLSFQIGNSPSQQTYQLTGQPVHAIYKPRLVSSSQKSISNSPIKPVYENGLMKRQEKVPQLIYILPKSMFKQLENKYPQLSVKSSHEESQGNYKKQQSTYKQPGPKYQLQWLKFPNHQVQPKFQQVSLQQPQNQQFRPLSQQVLSKYSQSQPIYQRLQPIYQQPQRTQHKIEYIKSRDDTQHATSRMSISTKESQMASSTNHVMPSKLQQY